MIGAHMPRMSGMAGMPTRLGRGAPALRAHLATGVSQSLVSGVRGPSAMIGAHMPRMSGMAGMPTRLGRGAPALRAHLATGVSQSLVSGVSGPRGVDLNLDEFDLSEHKRIGSNVSLHEGAAVGKVFWENIDGSDSIFKPEDRALFKQ